MSNFKIDVSSAFVSAVAIANVPISGGDPDDGQMLKYRESENQFVYTQTPGSIAFNVYSTNQQSLPSGIITPLTANLTQFNVSADVVDGVFVVPFNGVYHFNVTAEYTVANFGSYFLTIQVNGNDTVLFKSEDAQSFTASGSRTVSLFAGDSVRIAAYSLNQPFDVILREFSGSILIAY